MKRLLSGIAIAAVAMMGAVQPANADALDDIKKSGKIRIAVDLGVPPYGMTDDKMQPTGSDIETAKLLAADWGLQFEHVPTTGAARIPSLQTGKADLVISTLSITPERAKVIDFSKGYAVLRTVIAAPKSVSVKNLADLDGKTVGTVRGTTHDTQLTKEGPKGMKLVRYEDDATEAQAFLSGQVDIFSTAELLVAPIDKKNPARQVEVKFVLDTFKLAADDKMQPTGSDVDLARLLAKDLGVQLEIVATTGPTRIPMLQTNKADIVISTLSITPDRAKVIDFSVPYADHPSVVAGLKTVQIKQLSDLDGK